MNDLKTNLYSAIIKVMKEVKGIEKNLNVGTGNSSYKGVADKDVKEVIGKAMEANGLAILPIGINPTVTIDRYEETTQYGNNPPVKKMKQSVFTEVTTKYLLIHESGESIEIEGYGHGVDSQDKSAGKATTYALKYALLYTFMVATGKIDDADNSHSDDKELPPPQTPPAENKKPAKIEITLEKLQKEIDSFANVDQFIDLRSKYALTAEQKTAVTKKFNELFPNHKKTV